MSEYQIVLMPTAEEGLLEIASYIAHDNPDRAESFVREMAGSLTKTLSIFPEAGRVADLPEFSEDIRVLPYRNYLSYYRVQKARKTVEVLFIFNGKRDVYRFLASYNA